MRVARPLEPAPNRQGVIRQNQYKAIKVVRCVCGGQGAGGSWLGCRRCTKQTGTLGGGGI